MSDPAKPAEEEEEQREMGRCRGGMGGRRFGKRGFGVLIWA